MIATRIPGVSDDTLADVLILLLYAIPLSAFVVVVTVVIVIALVVLATRDRS